MNVDGWRDAYRGLVSDVVLDALDVGSFTARYREMLEVADPLVVFVAVDGKRIGAFCGVCPVRNADRDGHLKFRTGELAAIYADPPVRGSGAGHLVHDAALAHLAAGGFEHVVLWVMQANSVARTFCARRGSGKSTLLRLAAGELKPTLGSVTLRGRWAALRSASPCGRGCESSRCSVSRRGPRWPPSMPMTSAQHFTCHAACAGT